METARLILVAAVPLVPFVGHRVAVVAGERWRATREAGVHCS